MKLSRIIVSQPGVIIAGRFAASVLTVAVIAGEFSLIIGHPPDVFPINAAWLWESYAFQEEICL
jgi:hypothetical protein